MNLSLPDYTVIEVRWHSHPLITKEDGSLIEFVYASEPPDVVVKIYDTWYPAGCETWWIDNDLTLLQRGYCRIMSCPLGSEHLFDVLRELECDYVDGKGYTVV